MWDTIGALELLLRRCRATHRKRARVGSRAYRSETFAYQPFQNGQ